MIRFAYPWLLHLGWLLPVLLVLGWRRAGGLKRKLNAQGCRDTLQAMLPGWSTSRQRLRLLLQLLALALLIVAAAGPQVGTKLMEVERKGVDVILAVDVSQSMAAQDLAPDRMARARHSIRRLLAELHGDRVALLPFAGSAYLQNPLTTDYNMVGMLVDLLKPGLIPVPGTDLGAPIRLAMNSFAEGADHERVIVIMSDGEDFVGDWRSDAEKAVAEGVRVFTVGMASPEGAPVPDPDRTGAYKQDRDGSIVLSRLNEEALIELARMGNGAYYRSTPGGGELVDIRDRLDEMDRALLGSRVYSGWQHRYTWFLWPALVLLALGLWLPPLKRVSRSGLGAALLLVVLFPAVSQAARSSEAVDQIKAGNSSYDQGDYGSAVLSYQSVLDAGDDPVARFNLADAQLKSGDAAAAAQTLQHLLDQEAALSREDASLAADAWYNLGNAQLAQQQPDQALKSYVEALKRNPRMFDAKHNLELALQQMQQQQDQERDPDRDQQDQDQDQQKQDQQQDQQDQDQQKQDQQQQDQQQQDQQKQDQQQQQGQQSEQQEQEEQPQPQPVDSTQVMSPEQVQQILQAVQEMERETMEEQLKAIPGPRRKVEKDW